MKPSQLASLTAHLFRFPGGYLSADRTLHDLTDLHNSLLKISLLLGNQRRVSGDPVQHTQAGRFPDLVQVGSVQKEFHRELLVKESNTLPCLRLLRFADRGRRADSL